MANEIFALHLDGEIITPDIWKQYSKNYGSYGGLYGWRAPKKIYMRLGDAKKAVKHLPKEIQDKVEIVKYIPETY